MGPQMLTVVESVEVGAADLLGFHPGAAEHKGWEEDL